MSQDKPTEARQDELGTLVMCRHYDPIVPGKCWMGRYGSLKCHSERKDCPDYQPSGIKNYGLSAERKRRM